MAVAHRIEEAVATPRRFAHGRKTSGPARRSVLRLVPGSQALLHPRAAEALVLAFRPLSQAR